MAKSPQQPRRERPLQGHIDLAKWPRVKGWVWDPSSPSERIRLDLATGETRLLTSLASVGRPDIGMAGIGDGLHGFEIDLSEAPLAAGRHVVRLCCADTGTEVPGSPIILDVPAKPTASSVGRGSDARLNPPVGNSPRDREAPQPRADGWHDAPDRAAAVDIQAVARAVKPFRAFVDQLLGNEISGWIMFPEQPSHRCLIALREGRRELSRAVASQFRPDLLAAGIGDGRHAFSLAVPILDSDEHLLNIIELETGLPLTDGPIRWRGAPSRDETLAGRAASPDRAKVLPAGDELSAAGDGPVGKAASHLAAESDYSAPPSPPADLLDPAVLIEDLREQASVFQGKAVRPIPENLQGYVELVSVDPSGLVWIGGWIRQGNLLEFSAGISEAGAAALPAAVLLSCYGRDDLPEGSVGFIGLLHSAWRPTSATSEFLLVFGAEGRLHIRAHNPLRSLLGGEFLEHLGAIGPRWTAGRRIDALHRALKSGLSWLPIPAEKLGFPLNLSVDRVIVVPSYGCFVEGWVLSPVKRVASLRLRLGSNVADCDPRSLYWKPRLDLADGFSASAPLLARAGFVGLFPGDFAAECAEPVLNIRFDDGTSLNHPVPANALARLGNSADLSEVGRLYPAIHSEPFFCGWAMAVRREARLLNRGCIPFVVEPTEAALVFTVPADRCDAFLLFEELRQCLGSEFVPPGVVFIANRNGCRAETVALFGAMAHNADWPCSLFFMDDARYALHALPEVFSQTRMQRFVFVADSVLLTNSGRRAALAALSTPEPQLTFLDVERMAEFDSDLAEGPSTECFAWSTSAFIWWEKNAPGFFGGYYQDNGLGLDAPDVKRCAHGAVRAKQAAHDAIADAINAVGFA